ncbi:MAG TPA: tRNA (adenosine(37)-N6)-threonylcarbamoyltransferase complex dimerization subunit type 1 TsaB [Sphingomonadales bacterium]|nr:tRNA (adenosine(37)-N6)-threonylcarbamoyltransferase complex dimerization subunit type 1 TsaB [Sphingomonadales bacterium]
MLLALDTVAGYCSVALADAGGDILASFHEDQERGHAETLIPLIGRAFRKAKTDAAALRGIVVTTGPGTFAGVRVGLSAAKALSFAAGAKVLGLTTFETLMGLALLKHGARLSPFVLVVLPGRGAERAAELFARHEKQSPPWKRIAGPETLQAGRAESWLKGRNTLLFGPAAEGLQREMAGAGIRAENAWARAEDLLRMTRFFPRARWGKSVSPFYLRPPDARPSVIVSHG